MSFNRRMIKKLWYIYKGILLSHEKEHIWISSNEVNEPGAYYTEWSKSERQKQISYINTHTWNLEMWYWGTYCKEIQPVHSKGDQPWVFFGRNDAKAETPVSLSLSLSCFEWNQLPYGVSLLHKTRHWGFPDNRQQETEALSSTTDNKWNLETTTQKSL